MRIKDELAGCFTRLLVVCMHHRWITIGVTVAAFLLRPVRYAIRAAAVLPIIGS